VQRAAIAAAAAATLLGGFTQYSSLASSWTDPAAVDPGLNNSGGNANSLWTTTSGVLVKDGDVFKISQNLASGTPNGAGLTNFLNYYVVGVGSTPSATFKLTQLAKQHRCGREHFGWFSRQHAGSGMVQRLGLERGCSKRR
jgi:hypothetical protein